MPYSNWPIHIFIQPQKLFSDEITINIMMVGGGKRFFFRWIDERDDNIHIG